MRSSTPIVPQSSLCQAFMDRVGHAPSRQACSFQGQNWTYAEFARLIAHSRSQLLAWGVRPGDRVAALCLGHPLQLAALFALADLGAIWVPLNFRLAPTEWAQVIDDCQPVCLLADEAYGSQAQELVQSRPLPCHALSELTRLELGADDGPTWIATTHQSAHDLPVLLVYTSGTTGRPKGAVHTQGNLLANARAAALAQGMTHNDRVLTLLPLFHVGGLCIQTLPALLAGASLILHPKFEPDRVFDDLLARHITLTLMVPAVMKAMIEHPRFHDASWPHLRALWAGSSVLPDELVLALFQRGVSVCNVYGATETGPFSIALGPEHARSHLGSCGWPALGVEARLDLPAGRNDGVGEVCLRGPAIVRHYWPQQLALDAEGWFHTGDLARIDPDQSWRIVGRAKDMIISGGENIYPAEIENLLARHPAVLECAVVGLPDPRWGEQVVAVVVLRSGHLASDEQLLESVQASLARYKHPRRWVRLQALPKTALGKVQKDRLVRLLSECADTKATPSGDSPRSL